MTKEIITVPVGLKNHDINFNRKHNESVNAAPIEGGGVVEASGEFTQVSGAVAGASLVNSTGAAPTDTNASHTTLSVNVGIGGSVVVEPGLSTINASPPNIDKTASSKIKRARIPSSDGNSIKSKGESTHDQQTPKSHVDQPYVPLARRVSDWYFEHDNVSPSPVPVKAQDVYTPVRFLGRGLIFIFVFVLFIYYFIYMYFSI